MIDADGVIQYAPEDWGVAFARGLNRGDPVLESLFTAEIYAAETACLSRVDGFDEALQGVLGNWGRPDLKSAVLQTMLTIHSHGDVQDLMRALRARGVKCYVASNQQAQRAAYMSVELGYRVASRRNVTRRALVASRVPVSSFLSTAVGM